MYFGMFSAMKNKRKVQTGFEKMIDEEAIVIEKINPEGRIQINDEIWAAKAHGKTFRKDDRVRIRAHEGMTLIVEALSNRKNEGGG
jgi:membrane-bound ClpP family serine protease